MRCCLALLVLSLAWQGPAAADRPAPDFVLRALDGHNYRLSEYRGEVVAVVFWASWCGGCAEELGLLQSISDAYSGYGFQVLAVAVGERAGAAASMASALDLRYPVLYDADRRVSRAWDPPRLPTTFLLDRSGTVRHVAAADDTVEEGAELAERVRRLLEE